VTAWTLAERLEHEQAAIGFHLSGHPLDHYAPLFERMRVKRWLDFEQAVKDGTLGAGRLAGTVSARNDRRTRKGTPMMVLTLSDTSGSFECIAFSEQVAQFGELCRVGSSILITVEADERPDGVSLRMVSAQAIDAVASGLGRQLEIEADSAASLAAIRAQLRPGGDGQVNFVVSRERGTRLYSIALPGRYRVSPELAGGIKALEGVLEVRLS
jgi:DNA polymerase-3 subunit alpha